MAVTGLKKKSKEGKQILRSLLKNFFSFDGMGRMCVAGSTNSTQQFLLEIDSSNEEERSWYSKIPMRPPIVSQALLSGD